MNDRKTIPRMLTEKVTNPTAKLSKNLFAIWGNVNPARTRRIEMRIGLKHIS
jgi:hypothetical protein